VLGGLFRFAYTVAPFHGGPAAASTTAGSTVPSALNPNADATFVQLGALVDYYPDPESGWHAAASVGIGNIIVIPQATGADMSTATAFTALLLGGYEWRLGGDWSLGLLAVASGATSATLYDSGNNSTGYHLQPLSAGLEGSLLFY
jgi:hypothetical protein